jgi:hypothetical protein
MAKGGNDNFKMAMDQFNLIPKLTTSVHRRLSPDHPVGMPRPGCLQAIYRPLFNLKLVFLIQIIRQSIFHTMLKEGKINGYFNCGPSHTSVLSMALIFSSSKLIDTRPRSSCIGCRRAIDIYGPLWGQNEKKGLSTDSRMALIIDLNQFKFRL